MRGLLLALILVPSLSIAEIAVVSIPAGHELLPPTGQRFVGNTSIVPHGNQIAVLDNATDVMHLFEMQSDGSWLQFQEFQLPGEARSSKVIRFDFDGEKIAYTRKHYAAPDGVYALYVAVMIEPHWRTFGTDWVGSASGSVAIWHGLVASSRPNGVTLYTRDPLGRWSIQDHIPLIGRNSIGDNVAGPVFSLEGNRILMGTNYLYSSPTGASEYSEVHGLVYELDAANTWQLRADIPTDVTAFSFRSVHPTHVSMAGDQISVAGRLFRRDPYGYWEQTADPGPPSSSLLDYRAFSMLDRGYGVLTSAAGFDLHGLDSNGLWKPLARIAADSGASIQAIWNGLTVLSTQVGEEQGLFVTDLNSVTSRIPGRPATISRLEVNPVAARAGEIVDFRAETWVGSDGARVQKMEARVGSGAWIPMTASDGVFDDAYEYAHALINVPGPAMSQARICVRVTDTYGRVTELLDQRKEPCAVVETLPDTALANASSSPSVPEVMVPTPSIPVGAESVVYAFSQANGSGIHAMHFQYGNGTWQSMKPFPGYEASDFSFGAAYEAAQGHLPGFPELGYDTRRVCVRAVDGNGNVSEPSCTPLQISP